MARPFSILLRRQAPVALASALTALLLLLAFLQHRWLVQVSEAERERAHSHVAGAAAAFARDFNEPLSRLAFDFLPLFQDGPVDRQEDRLAELLASRLERWRGTAIEPEILGDVWVVGRDDGSGPPRLRRLDERERILVATEGWPPAFAKLLRRVVADSESAEPLHPMHPTWAWRMRRGSLGSEALDETIPALILPLFDRQPDLLETRPLEADGAPPWRGSFRGSGRWVILQLDRKVLADRVLPQLVRQYFRDAGFGLRVVSKQDPAEVVFEAGRPMPPAAKIEVSVDLFGPLLFSRASRPPAPPPAPPAAPLPPAVPPDVRIPAPPAPPAPPNEGIEEAERAAAPSAPGPPGPPAAGKAAPAPAPVPPAPPARPISPVPRGGGPGTPVMWLARAEERGETQIELGEGRWRLEVFHEEGSLDLAIDRAQRRNLTVAFGILLVLGLSMLFLARTARNAQELARRQMELVAGITHELLTPLSAMKSAGQNLRDGVVQEAPKVSRYGELIVKESDRLTDLVGQILLWAGLESRRTTPHREKVEPRQLAEAALADLRPALDTAGFEVVLEVAPDLPALAGDPAGLRQALGNLIANAVKYGKPPAGGRPYLHIGAQVDQGGERLAFEVKDRGPGVAAEDLPHLFEPFYRGRRVVASSVAGAGLGLALVRRIAEAHGGELRLVSVAGQGATFTLSLPLPRPPSASFPEEEK